MKRALKTFTFALIVVCGCVGYEPDDRGLEPDDGALEIPDMPGTSVDTLGDPESVTLAFEEMISGEEVIDSGERSGCECGINGRDTLCDYHFIPPTAVCSHAWGGTSGEPYVWAHSVGNDSTSQNLYLYCPIGDYYLYQEGYNQTDDEGNLSSVKLYFYSSTNASNYVSLYLASPAELSPSLVDSCGPDGSGYDACRLDDLDPSTDEFFNDFYVRLDTKESSVRNYVLGFRLCFDPDGESEE